MRDGKTSRQPSPLPKTPTRERERWLRWDRSRRGDQGRGLTRCFPLDGWTRSPAPAGVWHAGQSHGYKICPCCHSVCCSRAQTLGSSQLPLTGFISCLAAPLPRPRSGKGNTRPLGSLTPLPPLHFLLSHCPVCRTGL